MIWILLLCHFIADYPLQSNAMVEAKKQFWGLSAHVMIHCITMLVVMAGILQIDLALVLPGILALTGCHFAIDSWKNRLSKLRPDWVIVIYLQDQVLHIVSILLIAAWMEPKISLLPESSWIIPALAVLLVTYTWFVTERVVTYKHIDYQQWINEQFWSRMISRAMLLTAWFIGWNLWALPAILVGLLYHWLDLAGPFRFRAILTDVSVVLCMIVGLSVIN